MSEPKFKMGDKVRLSINCLKSCEEDEREVLRDLVGVIAGGHSIVYEASLEEDIYYNVKWSKNSETILLLLEFSPATFGLWFEGNLTTAPNVFDDLSMYSTEIDNLEMKIT